MSGRAVPPLEVTFFGDFTSPESYLTEVALWRVAEGAPLALRFRAARAEEESADETSARVEVLRPLAADLEVTLHPPALHPATGKAHEVARFARDHGVEREVRLAIHRAHWAEGHDVGRIDVLRAIAESAGLDPFDARVALDVDRYREEVEHDLELARRLRIARPPVTYLGSGAAARILLGVKSPRDLDEAVRELPL